MKKIKVGIIGMGVGLKHYHIVKKNKLLFNCSDL